MITINTYHFKVIHVTLTERSPEVIEFIRDALDLPTGSEILEAANLHEMLSQDLPFQPDIILKAGEQFYLIEVVSKVASLDTIARMQLLRELWRHKGPGLPEMVLVIAARTIRPREEQLAEELNIRVIHLPWTPGLPLKHEYRPSKSRITTEKSWKVVSRLLKEKSTSIRQLALREGVSYGWAHKTIGTLIEQKIVERNDSYVRIVDVKRLLNGIAWERPMKNLKIAEVPIDFSESIPAARDISYTLERQKIPFAFTGYTSGGLYTRYAVRQDAVCLYLEEKHLDLFEEFFGEPSGGGIQAWVYAPDRDVFTDTREIEGITVASPAQTLLDLAGLGYSAMDLTKAMVDIYVAL